MSGWRIPLTKIDLGAEAEAAVVEVVRSNWLSMGPQTEAFERAFDGIAVSSGTTALELAMQALGLGPGDEVIVPSLTFVATVHAVLRCGATPVFADGDPWLLPADVARRVTPRTRAVVAVHYAGVVRDMDALRAAAPGCLLVEDAAHCPEMRTLHGDVACYSFYSNKNLAVGEGGAVRARDPDVAARVRLLRSHGMSATSWEKSQGRGRSYDVAAHGSNARPVELSMALARIQLARLPAAVERRRALVERYRAALPDLDDRAGSHLIVVVLPHGADRDAVRAHLEGRGIETTVHYPPVHRFTAFDADVELPETMRLAPRLLTLPLHPLLTEEEVDEVASTLKEVL
ncbi:MAG: DegT/DnrJ/EryC1/StrS family aminotransferase [Planctomycetota bacterium]